MKQHRETRQRRLVLEVVRARDDHPSADQIYIETRQQDGRISRATVYRNLNCLAESGAILHVKVPGADRFDRRTDRHYHLICLRCGAVQDVPAPYHPELDRLAASASGYRIERHRTIFEGCCPDCLRRAQEE